LLGRALEELRASLYNDFQTSEGAKRQQQRLCGPVVAMTFNFMVAVGIIFANKTVSFIPRYNTIKNCQLVECDIQFPTLCFFFGK